MFTSQKKIVYITKTDIEGVSVSLGQSPDIKERFKTSWNAENLSSIIKEVVSKLSTDKVLLLLGQDLAYVLEFTLPKSTAEDSQRYAIYKIVQSQVPEIIGDDQWDYKESGNSDTGKKIIAFVPVFATFQLLSEAFHKTGCSVIATEPEQISKLRNPDPILGIALKDDITGKDQESLNLKLFNAVVDKPSAKTPSPENDSVPEDSETKPKLQKGYLMALLLVGIIGALSVGGITFYRSIQPQTQKPPVVASTPSSSPSPTVPIVADQINPEDYSVQIQNGSGIPGEADYVAGLLRNDGFTQITTSNADSYNYQDTVVQTKESSFSANLTQKIADILPDYTIEKGKPLTEDEDYDLLIIVGQKNEE